MPLISSNQEGLICKALSNILFATLQCLLELFRGISIRENYLQNMQ